MAGMHAPAVINHDVSAGSESNDEVLSEKDVRHNVKVNVLVSAVFQIGAADMALASAPLLTFLGASTTLMGVLNGLGWMSLVGVFLSPFISNLCPRKKWYMFWAHVPYIAAWGLIGMIVVLSKYLGLSNDLLLVLITVLSALNLFFAGFVTLPGQEFIAACIPMSHRGRYTGFSMSVGAVGSLISITIGGLLLHYLEAPMSFGWLYVMFWIFAQGGYLIALLAKEPLVRTASKPPRPWSAFMFRRLAEDKPFQRVWLSSLLALNFFLPCMVFVPIYAFKGLGLPATTAAVIGIVQQVSRLAMSSHIGVFTDRIGAKHMAPVWLAVAAFSVVPILIFQNVMALYVTVAIQAVCFAGIYSAFNPLLLGTPKPENRSGHYSIQLISKILLDSLAMMLTGVLIDRFGFLNYFGWWALLILFMAFVVWRVLRPLESQAEAYS
jgi:MFS family permease